MIFVYLKDGRRVDMAEAVSVVKRDLVMFLDRDDQVIRQIPPEEIIAYSHVPYDEAAEAHEAIDEPQANPFVQLESDALLLRRRRHRSSLRHRSS